MDRMAGNFMKLGNSARENACIFGYGLTSHGRNMGQKSSHSDGELTNKIPLMFQNEGMDGCISGSSSCDDCFEACFWESLLAVVHRGLDENGHRALPLLSSSGLSARRYKLRVDGKLKPLRESIRQTISGGFIRVVSES